MSEDPKEVLPDHCGAAGLRVEEMPAQITIDQQHDLRPRKPGQCQQDHEVRYEHQPNEQWHAHQLHTRTAQRDSGGDYVDGRDRTSDAREQQAQNPVVSAVAAREGPPSERRVSEPSDVWSRAVTRQTWCT